MRMIVLGLAAAAVIGLTRAGAQDSHTTCVWNGNFENCNTTTSPASGGGALSGFAKGFNDSFDRQGGLAAVIERGRERRAERAQQRRYVKAGNLIDAGKCPEARSFALTSGDLELAQRVAALCPAAPAQ